MLALPHLARARRTLNVAAALELRRAAVIES
jgi:hypothetical protein